MPGFQTKGCVEIPLETFGGRVTEMAPVDVPDGVSPDEQDNTYIPGAVLTRPCLEKVLTNAPANTTVTYQKSFVMPTGAIKNLYLFSNGELYWEDPINAPGIVNLLYVGPPQSYAKSATMFGREYIALNDTLHGSDVPMQWDGTNLDRVTQDGPGACPTITSLVPTPSKMAATGNTLTREGNIVTARLATAPQPPLQKGYQVQVSDVPDSNATTVNQSGISPYPSGQSCPGGSWESYDGKTWRTAPGGGSQTTPLSHFVATGFNFNIPSAATILGATVSLNIFAQSLPTADVVAAVALWQTGAQLGTAKTPGTAFGTTSYPGVLVSYGGAADLWGGALTPAIVNDPTFGFAVSCTLDTVRAFLVPNFTVTIYYTLSGSGTVAIISSIVIDNEVAPGLALVTTTEPHGLAPEEYVSIVGVEPGTVASIASAQWSAGRTTITTATDHKLTVGSVVQIASVSTSTGTTAFSFNGTFTVETVPSPNQITYQQTPITAADPDVINATASTGNITIAWPVPDTPTPNYFQVESAPSPTTFYVPVNYSNGTWATGTVGFIWEGTFYVTNVISPTQFQYQQYGPNGSTSAVGTVTPFGQAAPGFHLMRVNFQTRQGALLKPSPYVKFIANGGQYPQVSNIPIGPPDVVARILEFTGADGAYFFYLPIPAQVNGQIVSTATQINDNTTTSVLLDFSDNSLFGGIATSIPGNDLLSQIVLDGALGFGQYATRLVTYGQRNNVQRLLNLGFDGGYLATNPLIPCGWDVDGGFYGVNGGLVNAHLGMAFAATISTAAGNHSLSSSTSIGTSTGSGVAWTSPANIDSDSAVASVSLSTGGGNYSPSSASGSAEALVTTGEDPQYAYDTLSGFSSVPATSATLYITTNGTISSGASGSMMLEYSIDSGATWTFIQDWATTFSGTILTVPVSGILNLNTIQLRLTSMAAGNGFTRIFVTDWYASVAGGGGLTAQTLNAAITGLIIPTSATILGLELSFTGEYGITVPTLDVSLSVGATSESVTLTTSPASYTLGSPTDLWGYAGWTPTDLSSLVVKFDTSSTGASIVSLNNLVATIYYSATNPVSSTLSQSAYRDAYGNPIITGNQSYMVRFWAVTDGGTLSTVGVVNFSLTSASTGFSSTVTVNVGNSALAQWFTANFSAKMPEDIPEDLIFSFYIGAVGTGNINVIVDDIELIYAQTPYLDGVLFGSYGNNPEGIDGVTGKFGPVTDTRKVMDFGVLRETFYMLTQEPSGRLHETTDNGTTEPSGWTVNEVGANCGALSAFSLTKSQADDTAASGGEEWMAWASLSGARIFGGAYPDKISQEIQPDWEKINPAAALTIWCVNDPVERALYFGVPLGSATAPSKILFMSYRQLDSAQAIAGSPPFRVSFSGKLIATDNTRKWSLWNMSMNGAALMYRVAGTLSLVLGGGNGVTPGIGGYGNVYTLNPAMYTDDDYGLVQSYYFTYGFVNRGAEQALQVGSHQKGFLGVLATVTWPAGTMLIQVAPDNITNIWPLSCERTVSKATFDLQWGYGGMIIARGSRFFLKFSSVPLDGQTDNAYRLENVTLAMIPTRLKTRGAAQ